MEEDIRKCLKVLNKGGLILYPTDTIWGIGCDATSEKAVQKVYKLKMRSEAKSLIILLDDILKLNFYVEKVPPIAYDLIEQYLDPLTIIYPGAKNVAKNVIAKDGSIAIRIIREDFCRRLLNLFGKPIVSTSANISREETPLTFGKIPDKIKHGVDYVVKYGQQNVGQFKASTIIKISERGDFKTVRK
jgi:L-threonylcarbamoyladenylate synthase